MARNGCRRQARKNENMKNLIMTMVISTAALASAAQNDSGFKYSDEKFADLQMLRYKVEGFESLPLKEKTLVYYLQQAALCGRDILFDQNCRYNLRIRKMLETVYTDYKGDRSG